MKKSIIGIIALTLMFTITGCKNIGTEGDKAGVPAAVEEIDNKDGGESDTIQEGSSDTIYDKEDIIMNTEEGTYSSGVEEIKLNVENKSANEFYYGEDFSLEQEVDGKWSLVAPKEDIFVIEIAYILEGNGKGQITSHLDHYGELADGHYRIVKNMTKQTSGEGESSDQPESYLLAAEFNISSEVAQSSRLAAVYLSIENETYTKKDEILNYTIGNNTDEMKYVVLAPRLEKEVGDEWVSVECKTGFCGTPDSLEDKIESQIDLSWYPSISNGVYQISFDMQEEGGETTQISDIFTFSEE